MDCIMHYKEEMADPEIYNERYNASSISCGCQKESAECGQTCNQKKNRKIEAKSWKKDECALLYRQVDCDDCYLNPILLKTGSNFSTDNSNHINSVLVRDNCIVQQHVSAVKHYFRFVNLTGYFKYSNEYDSEKVKSVYHSDPETFWCRCGEDIILESIPQAKNRLTIEIALGIVTAGFIVTLSSTIFLIISNMRNRKQCEKYSGQGQDDSNKTELTDCFEILNDKAITNSPFDQKIETSREHFQLGDQLGSGHFGEVYKGTLQVAIKTVKRKDKNDVLSVESLKREIKILSYLGSHENVVRLLGASCTTRNCETGEVFLITEYCQNGSLKEYLLEKLLPQVNRTKCRLNPLSICADGYHQDNNGDNGDIHNDLDFMKFILKQFLQWSKEIANGMLYITLKQVVHVDLAARNVLLSHNLTAKIGDFGLSRKIYIKKYVNDKIEALPLFWVAPEALKKSKYSSKSDIWAYGVTLWEIFTLGKDPYDELTHDQAFGAVYEGRGLCRPQYASDPVYDKLVECWNENPDDRPSFQELRDYFALERTKAEQEGLSSTVSMDEVAQDKEDDVYIEIQ